MAHKNLLIVHAHDMGRYNSASGFPAPTPRMASFAKEAMTFRDAHAVAPTCSPSRAAMLTGQTAHQAGMFGLTHRGWDLNDKEKHLANWLGEQGYETVLAGVQHEFQGEPTAYKTVIPQVHNSPWNQDVAAANDAMQWLHDYKKQNSEKPFYLWLGLFMPHVPFMPADKKRFPPEKMPLPPTMPDTPETREDMSDYMQSVERTDGCFGMLLDTLREIGCDENTVVVLTTDHGIPFPKMKCNLTGHGTGVTLLVRDSELTANGPTSDALVSHLDLFPTVCDLLNLEKPDWLEGSSLRPLMSGEENNIREDSFSELNYHALYHPMRSIRTKRYNYIVSYYKDRVSPITNCDETRSRSLLVSECNTDTELPEVELYDLLADPNETVNLAEYPQYKDIRADMDRRLQEWLTRTNDPILSGELPKPNQ